MSLQSRVLSLSMMNLGARVGSVICRCASSKAAVFPEAIPKYNSQYSLDKVYPSSKPNLSEPPKIPGSPSEFNGVIPINKLNIKYSRSSKPGGQHVNKTNTKVQVSFHLESAEWIPQEARSKLLELHKNSISKEGEWSVKSEKTRAQTLNLADCLDKLRCYITEASQPIPEPSAETLESRREQAERAAASRLRQKRIQSMYKANKKGNSLD